MRESVAKMKSFSLDIPVLKKTIVGLDASIKNIEQIGIDIVKIAESLVSESWEGEATKSFIENIQNWKRNYDAFVNKIVEFKESLEKVILPKAEEINEKALNLTIALGGQKGSGQKNIISMEREGIEELKAKCKSLVYDAYESEFEIMSNISGLCSKLNYRFPIDEKIERNKKIIEENQQKLEAFKAQLQDYEDSVLELEALTVQEMAKYVTLGGQPMQLNTFKELLKYGDFVNLNKILSKSIEELSDIELLVLQAAYENGDTNKIKQYIGRQLDIQHLTYKQFNKMSSEEQHELSENISKLIKKIAPRSGIEYSSIEIPIGRDMSVAIYNVEDILELVKREKERTIRNGGDPTMAHKSVASAPEGAEEIMAQYGIHERLEAASLVTFMWPGVSEAIIGLDALIYLCEGDKEGLKKDAMFFGGIAVFKLIGRFIARPVCNYIGKKVSGLKPKVYTKKLFKKLGFDKALKQEEKAVSIETKSESAIAEEAAIKGGGNLKNITVEDITPPGAKNPVQVYTDGYSQVNKGKIDTYIRGKIKEPPNYAELKNRIKELKKLKNQNPSEFTKEMRKELDECDKIVHNYERSRGMGELLDDAGIIDTPENNEMIAKTILDSAKEVSPKNTKIRSNINVGNKPIIIESWWIIDKTETPYCSTIILIEVK